MGRAAVEGVGGKARWKVGSSRCRATEYGKMFSDTVVLGEWQVKQVGGTFSLQAGAEAEGSSLGWGLDIGSGSGDPVRSEELLRVSVKGYVVWCLGSPSQESRREELRGQ